MEQEPALIRLDSGSAFEPVFQPSQRTWPEKKFRKNSPDQRGDMQPAENWAGPRQERAEDHPYDEEPMHCEDRCRKGRVSIPRKNYRKHVLGPEFIRRKPAGSAFGSHFPQYLAQYAKPNLCIFGG